MIKRCIQVLLALIAVVNSASCNTDQIYARRIDSLNSSIPLTYNLAVKSHIESWVRNENTATGYMLGWKNIYFTYIEGRLKEKGLPPELKYLAASLSGLKTTQVAADGKAGLWNLQYTVARTYGLKINTYVDERRDPVRSTDAAISYLSDLHNIYKDWLLVIAAFQAGPLEVNKAIRKANSQTAYWNMEKTLLPAYREIVPKFIATAYICNYFTQHRIPLIAARTVPESDTVRVEKWLSFQQISNALDVKMDDLRQLNPVFRKDIIPYSTQPYIIRLPKDKAALFAAQLKDSVYRLVYEEPTGEELVENFQQVMDSTKANSDSTKQVSVEALTNTRVMYTVKRGDNLAKIANWFDCSVFELKEWNSMKSEMLRVGQRVLIYKPSSKAAEYRAINRMTPAQKKALEKK